MPQQASPDPPALLHAAHAAEAGVTRRQLQGRAWAELFPDVYARADARLTEATWADAARLAVPEGAIAWGPTAAWLHGVLHPGPGRRPVLHVARRSGEGQPRRKGQRWARLQLDDRDVVDIDGVRVTSGERTCFDLARIGSRVEAVVAVDAFRSAGLTDVPALWAYCQERRRWPGIDRLREALVLSSDRVRSPAESRLRMLLVLAGLPEPMVNVTLHDEDGMRLGTPDLLYLQPLLGIEYDGAYHTDGRVHQIDLVRENGLVARGLPLLRYCAHDLRHRPGQIVREVDHALRRLR